MGLLAPLYIAGLLGIALPILFHLIRRNPHGKQEFSSLMFLSPSPPRLTRRSRLTNIVLLILRSLAFAALAFAFARPYLAGAMDRDTRVVKGQRIGILLDDSASMRRGDLWKQAEGDVDAVLAKVGAGDQVALWVFDDRVRQVFTFDEWNQTEQSQRVALIKSRLPAEAGWGGTRLGDAVAAVADQLGETAGAKDDASALMPRQLVLISDMQEGGKAAALQGHQWPANVYLKTPKEPLKTKPGNASLQWAKQSNEEVKKAGEAAVAAAQPDAAADKAGTEGGLRVRVVNEKDSTKDEFTVVWANEKGAIAGIEPVKVYVPAGRSQMVRIPWPPVAVEGGGNGTATMPATRPGVSAGEADRVVLRGDDCDFDNTLYVVPPRMDAFRVLYVGADVAGDVGGLRYYLESAMGDSTQRKVDVIARGPGEAIAEGDLGETRLVVIAGAVAGENVARLRSYMEAGGDVLFVMSDAKAEGLAGLLGTALPEVKDVGGGPGGTNYALIGRVDVTHALFAPFADARFGDFTHIHFWKHREMKVPEGVNVLAAFDDGSPFLMEKGMGKGTLRVATSGWSPGDSQLALSSKFVPLMEGLVKRKDAVSVEAEYTVHEAIALPTPPMPARGNTGGAGGAAGTGGGVEATKREMITPDGKHVELGAGVTTFAGGDRPGIYRLMMGTQEVPLAVNLSADESQTVPLDAKELDQWGAKQGDVPEKMDELAKQERQLKVAELENRQKLWRWMIVGVLGLLCVETFLAGQVARRAMKEEVGT